MEEQTKQSASEAEKINPSAEVKTENKSGSKIPLIIAAVILVLAGLVYLFIRLSSETTGKIRDITLIIFALESVVTTAAIVVLCVQLAKLVNFLKYDISPILDTTSKTVKKFSGTVSASINIILSFSIASSVNLLMMNGPTPSSLLSSFPTPKTINFSKSVKKSLNSSSKDNLPP